MENETKWVIDPAHSEVAFKVKHLMISNVKGIFKKFNADVFTSNKDFTTAQINFWAYADSIDTGDIKRDEHLRSADFFDVKNHPQITFTGSGILRADKESNYELWGNLDIKGVSKRIKLNVEFGGIIKDPWGNEKAGFAINGKINRKDWGLEWNTQLDSGGVMVSEEVKIICDIELLNISQKDLKMELENSTNKKAVNV